MRSTAATTAARLLRLGRPRVRPAKPDPADMGTAFGLDQSLAPDVDGDADSAAPAPARADWLQRLGLKPTR